MIINTNKQLTGDMSPGHVASLQPRRSHAPPAANATYSGLIECPCTTRKSKLLASYLTPSEPSTPFDALPHPFRLR